MIHPETQVLLKSFGLGVYEAQLVPHELLSDNISDSFLAYIKTQVMELGLGKFQGAIRNDHNVGSYFVFFDTGHEPSKFEVSMMRERLEILKDSAEEQFTERIKRLENFYFQIGT